MEQKISHPSLMICAADDRVLPPSMAEGMPAYIDDLETHIIDDCGHWTQNEQPEQLAGISRLGAAAFCLKKPPVSLETCSAATYSRAQVENTLSGII